MAVEYQNHVTKEEVENSYEFKLIKKILKREFPWIIDIEVPSDDEINQYNLIFLKVFYNPFMLQKETGWPLASYMFYYISETPLLKHYEPYAYWSSYLSTAFAVSRDDAHDLSKEVEDVMSSVSKSAAIPKDLKLNKDRKFVVGEWIVPKMPQPEDAVFASKS